MAGALSVGDLFLGVRADMDAFQRDLKAKAADAGDQAGASLGARMKARLTAANVGMGIGAAVGAMAIPVMKLGDAYATAMDRIRTETGKTGAEFDALGEVMSAVAQRVPDEIELVGQAVGQLYKRTGQTGEGLERLTERLLDVSRITETDLSANIANTTRLFGDWSIATEDQEATLDKLFRTAQATGVGFDTLAESVVQFGAPLRALGISFDDSIAMLGKWEKEGVNVETVLAGLRMAVARFAAQGVDPREGLPALIEKIQTLDDASGLLAAKQIVGLRAANDFFRAVKEGRFDVAELVETVTQGSDTIAQATADTDGFKEAWRGFRNTVAVTVGPLVKDFADIGGELGNLVYLLPAVGGLLGRGLGALWTKAGVGSGVKAAARLAGAAAGVIYAAAAIATEKFLSLLGGMWAAVGKPGSAILARATSAGAAAGAAYAGAAGAGGLIGTIGAALTSMAPLAIPVVIAVGAKPILDQAVRDALGPESAAAEAALTGSFVDRLKAKDAARRAAEATAGEYWQALIDAGNAPSWNGKVWDPITRAFVAAAGEAGEAGGEAAGAAMTEAVSSSFKVGQGFAGAGLADFIERGRVATEQAFDDTVDTIKEGFGSIKAALANPPQLISRADRLENMEGRMRRIMRNLKAAVAAEDPANIDYWTSAATAQQERMDRIRGRTVSSVADIRRSFDEAGVEIEGTWLEVGRGADRAGRRVDGVGDAIDDLPARHDTQIEVDTGSAMRRITGLRNAFRSLPTTVRASVVTSIRESQFIGGLAEGGRALAGQAYVVGEVRPELFIPDVNGRIEPRVSAGAIRAAREDGPSGAAPVTLHTYGLPMRARTPAEVVTQVVRATRMGLLATAPPEPDWSGS